MEDFNSVLAALPTESLDLSLTIEDKFTLPQQFKAEPDASDLSELDDLLSASLLIAKQSAPPTNRRIYKELRKNTLELLDQFREEVWETLEGISVWSMTLCECGGTGVISFVKYMRKQQRIGQDTYHWETVETLPSGVPIRQALITRPIFGCENCKEVDYLAFEELVEVLR